MSKRGLFIVLEGIDGSGKSTQAQLLSTFLQEQGRRVHMTAEPTGGPIGSMIRQAFTGRVPLDDRTIAALFVADRIDHLTNQSDGILGLLAEGVDVVSDRYHLSSLAYHAGDVDPTWIVEANHLSTSLLRPDLTMYFDISPRQALSRLESRPGPTDRFEVFDRLSAAHAGYRQAIARFGDQDHVHRIDADGTPEQIFRKVRTLARSLLSTVPK
jgi:dTMP kinase